MKTSTLLSLSFFVKMCVGLDGAATSIVNQTRPNGAMMDSNWSLTSTHAPSQNTQVSKTDTRDYGTNQSRNCEGIVENFRKSWVNGQLSLHLKTLKHFNCTEFEDECRDRTYDFTTFTTLCYDRWCDETKYWNHCQSELEKLAKFEKVKQNRSAQSVHDSIRRMNSSLTLNDLLNPCVQVALINEGTNNDDYLEITENQFPFCEQIWCGFPNGAFERYRLSEWTCAPSRCQTNLIVMMVTVGLLALCVTVANVTVLFVFANNKRLRDSQGIYKMSLAIADALVGLVVLPTTIETMRRAYQPPYSLVAQANGTIDVISESFSNTYHDFVGFSSTLCLAASIYLLMIASFDRFMVVFHPLRYNLHAAKSLAIKLSCVVWVLVGVLSISPLVSRYMVYKKVAAIFICLWTEGDTSLIILACGFGIPLALVWIVNVATLVFSKKNARVRPKIITQDSEVRSISLETRLAKTLSIMVLSFTACLLPLVLVTVSHLFVDGIQVYRPRELNRDTVTAISSLEAVSVIILLSNSLWNFFIYNMRSTEFRKSCRSLFKKGKITLRSKLFRDSAKAARNRRTSAIPSHSSQVQCTNATTLTP